MAKTNVVACVILVIQALCCAYRASGQPSGEGSQESQIESCQIRIQSSCNLVSGFGYILNQLKSTEDVMGMVCDHLDRILDEELPKNREER